MQFRAHACVLQLVVPILLVRRTLSRTKRLPQAPSPSKLSSLRSAEYAILPIDTRRITAPKWCSGVWKIAAYVTFAYTGNSFSYLCAIFSEAKTESHTFRVGLLSPYAIASLLEVNAWGKYIFQGADKFTV